MLVLFWLNEPMSTDTCATEPAGSYVKTKTKFKDGLNVRRPTLPQLVVFYARVPVCLIPSVTTGHARYPDIHWSLTSVCQGVRRVQPYFHWCRHCDHSAEQPIIWSARRWVCPELRTVRRHVLQYRHTFIAFFLAVSILCCPRVYVVRFHGTVDSACAPF